ncbi:MAG TPA: hypothetical protein VIL42_07455 [Sphingomicrobium sp.]|jgi:hypothetical protein
MIAVALLFLAQAAQAAPEPAATPPREPRCGVPTGENAIVICAERPEGYRLNPDILEAKRLKKSRNAGRPRPNNPSLRPDCATVGPAPCVMAGLNLIGAALTAVQMAKRAAEGKEVGSMFVTDPQLSEYQLYEIAKAEREAKEAEQAAAKAKAAAQAKAAGK